MNIIILLIIWSCLLLIFMVIGIYFVYKGVGFKNAWIVYRVKSKRKKGWGLIRMRSPTGYPYLIPYKFEGLPTIKPLGEGNGEYNFFKKFMYPNEYDIPEVEYMEGEAEPIDPRTGLVTVTSPKAQENIVAGAIQARQASNMGDFMKFLQKYGVWILIIIGSVLGMILFMYLRQGDTLDVCLQNAGRTVMYNVSSLGK